MHARACIKKQRGARCSGDKRAASGSRLAACRRHIDFRRRTRRSLFNHGRRRASHCFTALGEQDPFDPSACHRGHGVGVFVPDAAVASLYGLPRGQRRQSKGPARQARWFGCPAARYIGALALILLTFLSLLSPPFSRSLLCSKGHSRTARLASGICRFALFSTSVGRREPSPV